MNSFYFVALGTPAPAGSKRAFQHKTTGKVVVMDSNPPAAKNWRQALREQMPVAWSQLEGPVAARCVFTWPRPKSAPKAEAWSAKRPDLMKLVRAVEDAITVHGLWRDDAQVVDYVRIAKVWSGHDPEALSVPGVAFAAVEIGAESYRSELRQLLKWAVEAHWTAREATPL